MRIKWWIGVLLCMLLCVGMLPAMAFAANEADAWDGTTDTSWYDPNRMEFHITTAEQLAGMAELLEQNMYSFKDKTIYLETDVDLKNIPWNPIGNNFPDESGNYYNLFSGAVFNGNGHVVYNLLIDASTLEHQGEANCGLFGFAENSSILNLGIENGRLVNKIGGFEDGLLAGNLNDCTVKGCYATGTIEETASINCIGGLIGRIYSSSSTQPVVIEQCYADVSITASANASATIGGFCTGSLWSRTRDLIIRDCYSSGSIVSESEYANVAGFAAVINWMPAYGQQNPEEASRGVIENCYSTMNINSTGFTADFAIDDGTVRNSCWIQLSDSGCLEGLDKCTIENTCQAYAGKTLPKESLTLLNARREDSPWVGFDTDKGPILSIEAHRYPADYTAVNAAIAKAGALNPDEYTDFSVVEAAVNAVVRGKNIAEQDKVDDMALAIENAIASLEKKPAAETPEDTDKPSGGQAGDIALPKTGDDSNIALWTAVLLAAGAALAGTAVYGRKRKYSR